MNIDIVCVGKLKEKYLRDAVEEYTKRLSRYCRIFVIEVKDEMTPADPSTGEVEKILLAEAERIKKNIKQGSYIIALDIKGDQVTSEALAESLQDLMLRGKGHLTFVIGGSLGLHASILTSAHWHLSFSRMTFPHQLMRVILCEQLYRSFSILKGEKYHK